MMKVFALELAFSKPTNPLCFCSSLPYYKNELFVSFFKVSDILLYDNDQACFSDTLTSARPLGGR